jgi:hypothetical protein
MSVALPPTQPIRSEHAELLPQIEQLRHTAAWMADAPAPVVREKVAHAVEFLEHHLVPHALADDDYDYDPLEGPMEATGAAASMLRYNL